MKKLAFALFFCTTLLGLSSCSSDDNEWRDNNLSFFDNLSKYSDVKSISYSSSENPAIYYIELKAGTGKTPVSGNKVKASYAGWLWSKSLIYNGKLDTDDAFDTGTNYAFRVGSGVIEGWNLAVQHMKVGSKWRVFIPYYLAYGSSGSSKIPGYSTLIFDITLNEITSEY